MEHDENENAGVTKPEVMEFRSAEPLGFFNTFRIGKKWAGIQPGDGVTLVRVEGFGADMTKTTYAGAEVLAVYSGPLVDMLDKHIGTNFSVAHMTQASDQKLALLSMLDQVYGRQDVRKAVAAVVYLAARPLDKDEG